MSPLEYFIPDYLSSEHFLFVESSLKEHTEPVLQYFVANTPENALYSQAEKTCKAMLTLQLPKHIKENLPTIIGDYLGFLATRGVFPQASTWQLKFEQLKEGIQTPVPYQTREIKLLQPFGNDFEDF